MLVLDTDLLTLVQQKSGAAYVRLDARLEAAAGSQVIVTTIVSFEEQMRGWLAYIANARTLERQLLAYARLHELFDDYRDRTILDFDQIAGSLFRELVRGRLRVGTMDLKIAAIALAHGATLLSRNLSDFRRIPGLRVEDWSTP
jgi:tRNA(fMet)-specific endonuclease VapC